MIQKLILPVVAAVVLCVATPSSATYWGNTDCDWGFDWPSQNDGAACDWGDWGGVSDNDWNSWPSRRSNRGDWNHTWPGGGSDWDCNDWDWDCDWDWQCPPDEDPVPEPATAGLSLMGLAALGVATRRRRK
jgi:PEP-CTERM motif